MERLATATAAAPTDVPTGVWLASNDTSERGGFSVYVPEDYDPAHAHPLVMALHGGSGHGRLFLWSWVRAARGRGLILVAPTATGDTWSLVDPEVDSAHLPHVLEQVAQRWHVDRTRLLLTGMSDGGTFTLLSGLDEDSPFTHLAAGAKVTYREIADLSPAYPREEGSAILDWFRMCRSLRLI